MKKIALIPIDNRPVSYNLPSQTASLAKEYKLYMPDKSLLGGLEKPACTQEILKWLKQIISQIDIVIISLDTIAYGGLIPSRRTSDSFEEIKERIDNLVNILHKKQAKVYSYSSIMRISNNNINEEEKEYWNLYGEKIFKYSYNKHKQQVTNTITNEAANDIPSDILNDYLKTRSRNFEINKYYIKLKKDGIIDTLVFSKDDCAKYGINVAEAEELAKLSQNESGIYIKTGADEIPLSLLSRALNQNKNLKIAPVYINPNSTDKISRYEDISVKDAVNSQIELAGAKLSAPENCDLIMLVNNFKTEQGELVMNCTAELFQGSLELPDKPYFIADIVNANGSDNNFVEKLLEKDNLKEFYGYAGWNTTGNTLGSAISAALTYYGAKHPDRKAFQQLQFIRFLDDWAYQANVRAKIRDDKTNLNNDVLKKEMEPYEKILTEKFSMKKITIQYTFPWNRFFETEIKVKHQYTNIPFIDILFYE